MSIISFGPNQQLNEQQHAAHEMSQRVKSLVWDTIHRLAALNDIPGVDEPDNGDDVDVRNPTPLPPAHPHSLSKFEANATGRVERAADGQLVGGEVHAQLTDGRLWVLFFRYIGDEVLYSAPSPSGQSQVHVSENAGNGQVKMFESDRFHPDFAQQLQQQLVSEQSPPPPPLPPPPLPPPDPGFGYPEPPASQANPLEQFGSKFMDLARKSQEEVSAAVKSNNGRKWGKLLIGSIGMDILDKAMGKNSARE